MKKLVPIFFFLCLTAPFAATYLWLQHTKHQVKKQVKRQIIAGMNKDDLVLLRFSKEDTKTLLKWKHSKEFEYRNSMYDIVEEQQKGDSVYYWCWWDYEETRLNRDLTNMVASILGHNPQKKENQKRLTNFIKNLYHEVPSPWNYSLSALGSLPRQFFIFLYSSTSSSPPAPPPQLA